jgi:hypothetical protein
LANGENCKLETKNFTVENNKKPLARIIIKVTKRSRKIVGKNYKKVTVTSFSMVQTKCVSERE